MVKEKRRNPIKIPMHSRKKEVVSLVLKALRGEKGTIKQKKWFIEGTFLTQGKELYYGMTGSEIRRDWKKYGLPDIKESNVNWKKYKPVVWLNMARIIRIEDKDKESKQFRQRQAREKREKNISKEMRLQNSRIRSKRANEWDKKKNKNN